jgi:hypothetical protein
MAYRARLPTRAAPSSAGSRSGRASLRNLRKIKLKVPTIRAGFVEIDGIGPKSAQAIVEYRDARGGGMEWGDLINLPGDRAEDHRQDRGLADVG